jgi:dTMP kinase
MLITLEGIEGSGKTTQIESMAAYLRECGRQVVVTKEPGGTELGRQIRSVLLNPDNSAMHPVTELLLYAADRAQHVRELIQPMLAAGKIVICDRFCDSTTVYQGFVRGLEMPLIRQLNQVALGGLLPAKTFLLDLAPDEGLKRAWTQISDGSRPEAETRFEKRSPAIP